MGALENHANATEGCNEEAGRLHYCNTTADRGSFTCRLCGTCRLGFAKNTQGSCESCDADNFSSILASVGLLLLLFIIVFVLIFLKIKTATSGHGAKTCNQPPLGKKNGRGTSSGGQANRDKGGRDNRGGRGY